MMEFKKATKKEAKLRMTLDGPPGSGKTYTALKIGSELGKKIALIDTERGSASKYSDEFEFDVLELDNFMAENYIGAIEVAEKANYDVLIIDSLSHAWAGKDGILERVDKFAKRSQSGNTFTAWREATPLQNRLIDTILGARLHVITTMRVKTEYVLEENDKGKKVPRKVGLAPIQRDQLEYEFDIVGDLNAENELIITKSRCKELSGQIFPKPGKEVAKIIKAWLHTKPVTPQGGQVEVPKDATHKGLTPDAPIEAPPPVSHEEAVKAVQETFPGAQVVKQSVYDELRGAFDYLGMNESKRADLLNSVGKDKRFKTHRDLLKHLETLEPENATAA